MTVRPLPAALAAAVALAGCELGLVLPPDPGAEPPEITSISVTDVFGGEHLRIDGSSLGTASETVVRLGGQRVDLVSVTGGVVEALVPPTLPLGAIDVAVTTLAGTATKAGALTFRGPGAVQSGDLSVEVPVAIAYEAATALGTAGHFISAAVAKYPIDGAAQLVLDGRQVETDDWYVSPGSRALLTLAPESSADCGGRSCDRVTRWTVDGATGTVRSPCESTYALASDPEARYVLVSCTGGALLSRRIDGAGPFVAHDTGAHTYAIGQMAWIRDGIFLVRVSGESETHAAVVDAEHGTTTVLPGAFSVYGLGSDPARGAAVGWMNGGLAWLRLLPDGTIATDSLPIRGPAPEQGPVVSRDGRRVAYANRESVVILDVEQTPAVPVAIYPLERIRAVTLGADDLFRVARLGGVTTIDPEYGVRQDQTDAAVPFATPRVFRCGESDAHTLELVWLRGATYGWAALVDPQTLETPVLPVDCDLDDANWAPADHAVETIAAASDGSVLALAAESTGLGADRIRYYAPGALAPDPDEELLTSGGRPATLYDTEIPLSFSTDGRRAILAEDADRGGALTIFDLSNGWAARRLLSHKVPEILLDVAFLDDSRVLVTTLTTISVLDTTALLAGAAEPLQVLARTDDTGSFAGSVVSARAAVFLRLDGDRVYLHRVMPDLTVSAGIPWTDMAGSARTIALSPNGLQLAAVQIPPGGEASRVTFSSIDWDRGTIRRTAPAVDVGYITSMRYLDDGGTLLVTTSDTLAALR